MKSEFLLLEKGNEILIMKKIFPIILILIFIGLSVGCEKEEKILEICTCIEDTDVYTGPGTNFEKDNSKQPIKGIKLYTLEMRGDWIRFRLTPEDSDWNGWIRIDATISWEDYEKLKAIEEEKRIEEENKKIAEWIADLLDGIELFKRANISEDRLTLKITVSDLWYHTPNYLQERLLRQAGLEFAYFALLMEWVEEDLDKDKYPTVIFFDEFGKEVGKHSTQGVEIYISR
jgi:hypothetical protein